MSNANQLAAIEQQLIRENCELMFDNVFYREQLTAITRVVYDQNAGSVIFTDTLTVADVIFDSLQTSGPWDTTTDPAGFTFKDAIPGTRFPSANADQGEKMQAYIVEYHFDMEDEFDFVARAAHHNTEKSYGS